MGLSDRDSDWFMEGLKSAQTTLRSADEVLTISSEQGFPVYSGIGTIMRGWSLSALEHPAEGISLLLRGVALYQATGGYLLTPFYLMTLAEVCGKTAQTEQGLSRLAEASKLVEMTQERWGEAEMHRLRGKLLATMNEQAAAESSYRQALIVARAQSAKLFELRAATSLARLLRDGGKGMRPAIFSLRFTAGSPKASTRLI
jgi:predicted ATPase